MTFFTAALGRFLDGLVQRRVELEAMLFKFELSTCPVQADLDPAIATAYPFERRAQ